jgi:hypothetical protein
MSNIWINLVFEDVLSEMVLRKMLSCSRGAYMVHRVHNGSGFGWIKRRIQGFNNAARGVPYLVLTDLDTSECAPVLMRDWLNVPRHPNLLFRVAVRQVEAWLLGCRESCAAFLGVPRTRIPIDVDAIPNPKRMVVNLAKESKKRDIRLDVAPKEGSTAKVGPNYNGRLISFVQGDWDPAVARENSDSLRRTMDALERFHPTRLSPADRGDG